METTYFPRARQTGLVIQTLPQETLVFDREREQANCLNHTAALVWKYADGTRSVSAIADAIARELNTAVDAQMVWYALDQLAKKNLLVERVPTPPQYMGMSRRAFLSKAGLVGAAVAIPVIVSIAAPSSAHAQSKVCIPGNQPCIVGGTECCPGLNCIGNFCIPHA